MEFMDRQIGQKFDASMKVILTTVKDYIELMVHRRVSYEVQRHLDSYFNSIDTPPLSSSFNEKCGAPEPKNCKSPKKNGKPLSILTDSAAHSTPGPSTPRQCRTQ